MCVCVCVRMGGEGYIARGVYENETRLSARGRTHAQAKPNGSSFVSTGDQASMYLRDSQNQVLPYIRFAKAEPNGVGRFLRGIIKRYVGNVLLWVRATGAVARQHGPS